ncbi:MAG: hemerythrin domain-containing protein [Phyllobacterium sp.]
MNRRNTILQSGEENPLTKMKAIHDEQTLLCDTLERIADSLPHCTDRAVCTTIGEDLVSFVREVHHFEENVIFPLFENKLNERAEMPVMIQRLKVEHHEDEYFAEEVADALRKVGRGEEIRNPEAFGYMLRAFFETRRRHIAFEQEQMIALSLKENEIRY